MSYGDHIEDVQFPGVKFTGRSRIHRSFARTCVVPHGRENVRSVMSPILAGNLGGVIWQVLRAQFSGLTWIVKGSEFESLLAVDYFRHLTGAGDSYTKHKLKNNVTGSRFHQVALKDDTVCGIRVWVNAWPGGTSLAFRFRLEQKSESEAATRGRTASTVVDALVELEKIKHSLTLEKPSETDVEAALKLFEPMKSGKSEYGVEDV